MHSSYRVIIQQTFDERIRTNPYYSMRSYARDLGLAPSTLSEILKGKKGLSPKKSVVVAKAMRLPDWQVSYFRDLVVKTHGRSRVEKKEAIRRLRKEKNEIQVKLLKNAAAKALTSWLDLAILETIGLADFRGDQVWLAKKLGATLTAVNASVSRLQNVGLLKIHDSGRWEDLSPFFSTTDGVSSETIQQFHKDVLRTFSERLEGRSIDERIMKSVVFSLEEAQLLEAKGVLDEAVSKIVSLASRATEKKHHVMCFSSQLFFLTQKAEVERE